MESVRRRASFSVICLWLMVLDYSAAQCPLAKFPPSDVLPNLSTTTVTEQLTDEIARLQKRVPAVLQSLGVDTYAVAAVYRNETLFTSGMADTPFRIGSVSKVFAAMGALVLRQRGRLSLDDPVTKFLPSFSVINPYDEQRDAAITLRELMGHLSGLPRELCAGAVLCGPNDEKSVLKAIAKMELVRPPWSNLPTYSNLGYATLAHAWEKATRPRQTWDEFVRDAISRPLKMHTTGLDDAEVEIAPGVVFGSAGNLNRGPPNASIGWMGPTGGMYSTAADLAKLVKFMLKPDQDLLTAKAVREWTNPTSLLPDEVSQPRAFWGGFAMTWELTPLITTDQQTTTLVVKGGSLGTYLSTVVFHPETQLGLVVLTSKNSSGMDYPNNITTEVLPGLIPAVQAAHAGVLSDLYSGVYACRRSATAMVGRNFPNTTYQVLGGQITVPPVVPGQALLADLNVTFLTNGEVDKASYLAGPVTLLLKSAAKHSFWSFPGPCSLASGALSYDPEIARPNFPESVYHFELQFEPGKKVVRAPGIGAECYMS